MDWATIIVAVVSGLLGGGGTAAVVSTIARRKLTSAEVTERLTDSALEMLEFIKNQTRQDVTDLRTELDEARREVRDARRDARETGRQMTFLRRDATALVAYLDRVLGAINDPSATLERVRLVAGAGPPNGVSSLLRDEQLG